MDKVFILLPEKMSGFASNRKTRMQIIKDGYSGLCWSYARSLSGAKDRPEGFWQLKSGRIEGKDS